RSPVSYLPSASTLAMIQRPEEQEDGVRLLGVGDPLLDLAPEEQATRPRPPGIEIPGYRRPSHPGLPWKPRPGAAVGRPGFQSRAGERRADRAKDGAPTPRALLVERFGLMPLPAASRELATVGGLLGGKAEVLTRGRATERAFREAAALEPRVV